MTDLLSAIWLWLVVAALAALSRYVSAFGIGIAAVVFYVFCLVQLLAYAKIINPITLALALVLPLLFYLRRRKVAVIGSLFQLRKRLRALFSETIEQLTRPEILVKCCVILVLVGIALYLRIRQPLAEVRYATVESYELLLSVRKLIAAEPAGGVLASLMAALSLLASVDAINAVRFLTPLVGLLLVVAVAATVRATTVNASSWIIAAYALSAYTFDLSNLRQTGSQVQSLAEALSMAYPRQWAAGELELALIFLLLTCLYLLSKKYLQAIFAALLVTLYSPLLLSVAAAALFITYVGSRFARYSVLITLAIGLFVPAILCFNFGLPNWGTALLPAALALTLAALAEVVAISFPTVLRDYVQAAILGVFIVLSLQLLPQKIAPRFLEYDATARASLRIVSTRPRKRWSMIAPIEQLPQVYGCGWYEDLGEFVDRFVDFDNRQIEAFFEREVYVFVEKVPFNYFGSEPAGVPFDILADKVYRRYRSPAGRTALQYRAMQVCETLLRNGGTVYYEDEYVKIYRFGKNGGYQ
ncbi:MAG: hypothetical protein RMM17_01145 [Acidobacteriota bacterium]|nr:hypothetical protein [Blastocatellia bacterium]MDW8411274.1 hypothetical protein [Acidobacteriota bacterium]